MIGRGRGGREGGEGVRKKERQGKGEGRRVDGEGNGREINIVK